MKEPEPPETFDQILQEYEKQLAWLESLITDPAGNRYLIDKSPAERLQEYQQQLERTTALLDFLDNPQDKFQSVHVAGTGGKGSVTTMIGSLLEATGQCVGIHTSPYLQVANEKLLINGRMVPPSRFSRLLMEFRPQLDEFTKRHPDLSPRYGEVWVALTYLFFAQERVDWAVIETGMGGRFDPTNVLSPKVAVITNVDFDHVPQLGTSLAEIADHKAGIIKPQRPVVTGEDKPEVLKIIQAEAAKNQASMFRLGQEFAVSVEKIDQSGSVVNIKTPTQAYPNIRINLAGSFQPKNAAIAVTAAELTGQLLTEETINRGLSTIKLPGRMEKIQANPTVILDGAHNPQKTRALAESIKQAYGERPYTLVVGMLATKDAHQAIIPLLVSAKRVIATAPNVIGKPAISPYQMRKIILETDPGKTTEVEEAAASAIRRVLETALADDLIVVTGSIYMLGEARNCWITPEQLLLEAEYGVPS